MTEGSLPVESGRWIRVLLSVSVLWFLLGYLVSGGESENQTAFIQIFLFSFLDLVFLMLIFWNLFFPPSEVKTHSVNKIRIFVFGFFKLVCLAFLAITLKRLRNASAVSHVMGVSIIWIAPLIAGIYVKYFPKLKND